MAKIRQRNTDEVAEGRVIACPWTGGIERGAAANNARWTVNAGPRARQAEALDQPDLPLSVEEPLIATLRALNSQAGAGFPRITPDSSRQIECSLVGMGVILPYCMARILGYKDGVYRLRFDSQEGGDTTLLDVPKLLRYLASNGGRLVRVAGDIVFEATGLRYSDRAGRGLSDGGAQS
ncbi:MAG: hypothetical protein RJQ08_11355 [Salinisphaeraceae bacterium]